jgi:2-C-methyl-D-erythritol 2,4-cyclodiphosphate synthase
MQSYEYCSALGQDSHRFMTEEEWSVQPERRLMLGGLPLPWETPLAGNSDADVVLHALTNAISGVSGINVLGVLSDRLCLEDGVTDSAAYLQMALATIGDWQLCHVSIAVEGKRPKMAPVVDAIKERLADLTGLLPSDIGLTATSGEELTAFGRGEGLQAFCMISARRPLLD